MKCFNCGNEVTTEGTNCPFCGSPLSAQPETRWHIISRQTIYIILAMLL